MQSFKKLDSRLTQTLESTSLSPFYPKYSLGAKTGHKYAQRLLNRGSCFSQTKGRSITKKGWFRREQSLFDQSGATPRWRILLVRRRIKTSWCWRRRRDGGACFGVLKRRPDYFRNGVSTLASRTNEGVLQVVLEQRDEQHDPDAGWHAQDL